MRAARARIARLIALVLLLQAVAAPALCLAAHGGTADDGTLVAICGPDGLHLARIPAGDDDPPPAYDADHGVCVVCHALPQAAVLRVPVQPPPAWAVLPATWQPRDSAALPPGARAPPFSPRAPPTPLS